MGVYEGMRKRGVDTKTEEKEKRAEVKSLTDE